MFCCRYCSCCEQYCAMLLSLNFPAIRCNNAKLLLTTMNNMGSKTLFDPVFINHEQVCFAVYAIRVSEITGILHA